MFIAKEGATMKPKKSDRCKDTPDMFTGLTERELPKARKPRKQKLREVPQPTPISRIAQVVSSIRLVG
jgi:hypothetical protein